MTSFFNFISAKSSGLLVLLFCFFVATSQAQHHNRRYFEKNIGFYDDKDVRFGFLLGGGQNSFYLKYSNKFLAGSDTVLAASPKWGYTFPTIGAMVAFKLNDFFFVRTIFQYQFYQRNIEFRLKNGDSQTQIVQSSSLELPVLLKYKSLRRGNVGMYMIAGIKPTFIIGGSRFEATQAFKTNDLDLSVEYGFGFDLYYTYFKLAPEIRFSHGLVNMNASDNNIYNNSLKRITTHNVSLILNFDGY
jgi:hypothetical protein